MTNPSLRYPVLLALTISLLSCSGDSTTSASPRIDDARIRLPPPGMEMAAAYFSLKNPGSHRLRITSLQSAVFEELEIHQTVEVDGIARMRELESLEISPGTTAVLRPGGMHLMLMGFRSDPREVERIPIRLTLTADDGTVHVLEEEFNVESAGRGG